MNLNITNQLTSGLESAKKSGPTTRADAKKIASQFEALFVNTLLSSMKSAVTEDGFFGSATGSQVQEGLFTTMMADKITANGPGLGMAERLVADWARQGLIPAEESKA